ncbi:uncharacterized protein [Spinacia oleracea]|uniref:NAC domain-containing protein n=1 Tax=Spinacia oleracea TaxID=3562 RepID=A0A9R0INA0_SPIOL|nr:uncharacterized protein LOC110791838 [Spinacia oleracea]
MKIRRRQIEWLMHEYQTLDQAESSKAKTNELKRKRNASTSMRLDIVLCKIYYKKRAAGKKPADKKTVQVTDMDAAGNPPDSSRRVNSTTTDYDSEASSYDSANSTTTDYDSEAGSFGCYDHLD